MKKVLLIEDDAALSLALQVRLAHAGYDVKVASDALCGVNEAWEWKPDVIVLDVVMPNGGGFRVAENVVHLASTRETPIIFITAYKDPDIRQRAAEFAPYGFLEKPFDATQLIDMIEGALTTVP